MRSISLTNPFLLFLWGTSSPHYDSKARLYIFTPDTPINSFSLSICADSIWKVYLAINKGCGQGAEENKFSDRSMSIM